MKTALRVPLALAIVAVFAAAAHAQQPPPPGAKAPPGKGGLQIMCPDALHGTVHEQLQAPKSPKDMPPWKLQSPEPHRAPHLFAEMTISAKGEVTCKYHDLDSVLVVQAPPKCQYRYVGPWSDGSNIGATRLPTKAPGAEMTCKGSPPPPKPAPGTSRSPGAMKPGPAAPVACAVECPK